jgi:hypothetical protein
MQRNAFGIFESPPHKRLTVSIQAPEMRCGYLQTHRSLLSRACAGQNIPLCMFVRPADEVPPLPTPARIPARARAPAADKWPAEAAAKGGAAAA